MIKTKTQGTWFSDSIEMTILYTFFRLMQSSTTKDYKVLSIFFIVTCQQNDGIGTLRASMLKILGKNYIFYCAALQIGGVQLGHSSNWLIKLTITTIYPFYVILYILVGFRYMYWLYNIYPVGFRGMYLLY